MRVQEHIAVSAIFSIILYFIFKSLSLSIAAFLSGFLIDLDHVLECYINYGRKFNIWRTIEACESFQLKKAYFFLHSYELVLIYSALICWLGLGPVWYGIALGLALHIVLDSVFNSYHPNGLFFIARHKKNFEYSKIVDINASMTKKQQRKRKK